MRTAVKKWVIAAAVIVIVAAIVIAAAVMSGKPLEIQNEPVPQITDSSISSDAEGVQVKLGSVALTLPMDVANEVFIEASEEDGEGLMTVSTSMNSKTVVLYTLILSGKETEGDYLGALRQDDGDMGVYLRGEGIDMDAWSPEEADTLNRLQESVNTLLEQIYSMENYIAG